MTADDLSAHVGARFVLHVTPPGEKLDSGVVVTWWAVAIRRAVGGALVADGTGETLSEACGEARGELDKVRARWRQESAGAA